MADVGFKFLEHTADILIEAYGRNLKEAFQQAAKALFEVITDTATIGKNCKEHIVISAEDEYSLLFDWLSELLYLFDTTGIVYCHTEIKEIKRSNEKLILKATVMGDKLDLEKNEIRTEVKAITYHQMEIKQDENRATVRFLVDI